MRRNLLCVLGSVVLLSVGWLGLSGVPLLVALIPLLYMSEQYSDSKKDWWRMAGWSLLCIVLWNVATVWWIWNSTPIGPVAATFFTTFWTIIPVMLYHYVSKRASRSVAYPVLISAWLACEHLYTHMEVVSFPWLSLGNGFSGDVWAVQWYEYTGVGGGTLWVLLANVAIFEYLRRRTKWSQLRAAIVVVVPMVVSIIMGWNYQSSGDEVQVSVLQPNVDCYEEKFAGSEPEQMANIMELLGQVPASSRVAVLPETAIPYQIDDEAVAESPTIIALGEMFAQEHPETMLVGGVFSVRVYEEGEPRPEIVRQQDSLYYNNFNSAVAINSDSEQMLHHKMRLVVGVEAMPQLPLLDNFVDLGGVTGQLGRNDKATVFRKGEVVAGPAICYEGMYGEEYARFVTEGANLMLVLSNDGWWGDTPGHKRLFDFCRLRAIETRRSVARSANTGVSGFITPTGEVLQRLDWDERGVLTSKVELRQEQTFYVRYGDWIGRTAMILTVLCLLYYSAYRVRRKNHLVE